MVSSRRLEEGIIATRKGSSLLIRLAEDDSLLVGLHALNFLVKKQENAGIYVTCNPNAPSDFLNTYFTGHDIDMSKVQFIDTVTVPFLGRQLKNDQTHVFTNSSLPATVLGALDKVVLNNPQSDFIFLDSITALLKYHDKRMVVDFLENLVGMVKDFSMSGLIFSFYGQDESKIVAEATRHCDVHVKL